VRDDVRAVVVAAPEPRGRLGKQRPARLGGEPGGGLGDRLGGRPAHDQPARLAGDALGDRVDVV
jgi:hypothetical protein